MSAGPILHTLIGEQAALAAHTLAGQAATLASGQGAVMQGSANHSAAHTQPTVVTHAAGPLASLKATQHPALWRPTRHRLPVEVIDRRIERGEIVTRTSVTPRHPKRTTATSPRKPVSAPRVTRTVIKTPHHDIITRVAPNHSARRQTAVATAGALLLAACSQGVGHHGQVTDIPLRLKLDYWVLANPELSFDLAVAAAGAVTVAALAAATIVVMGGVAMYRRFATPDKATPKTKVATHPKPAISSQAGSLARGAWQMAGAPFRALGRAPQAVRVLFGQTTPLNRLLAGGMTVVTDADIAQALAAKMTTGIPALTDTAGLEDLQSALGTILQLNRARVVYNILDNQTGNTQVAIAISEALERVQSAITTFFANLNASTREQRVTDLPEIEDKLLVLLGLAETLGSGSESDSSKNEKQFYDAVAAFTKNDGPAQRVLKRTKDEYIPSNSLSNLFATGFEGFDSVRQNRIFLTSMGTDVPFANRVVNMNDTQPNGLGRSEIYTESPSPFHSGRHHLYIAYDRYRLKIGVGKNDDDSVNILTSVRGRGDIQFERVRHIPAADATPARLRQELHQAREYLRTTLRTQGKAVDGALTMAGSDPTIALEPPFAAYLSGVNLSSGHFARAGSRRFFPASRTELGGLATVTYTEPDRLALTYDSGNKKAVITIKALADNRFDIDVTDPHDEEDTTTPGSFDGNFLIQRLNHRLETLISNAEKAGDKQVMANQREIFVALEEIKPQLDILDIGQLNRDVGARYLASIDQHAETLRSAGMTRHGVEEALRPYRELVRQKMAPEASAVVFAAVVEEEEAKIDPDDLIIITASEDENLELAVRLNTPPLPATTQRFKPDVSPQRKPSPTIMIPIPAPRPAAEPAPADPVVAIRISPAGIAGPAATQAPAAIPVPANRRTGAWGLLGEAAVAAGKAVRSFFLGSHENGARTANRQGSIPRTVQKSGAVRQAPLPVIQPRTSHEAVANLAKDVINRRTLSSAQPAYTHGSITGEWAVELKHGSWIEFDKGRDNRQVFQMNLDSLALARFLRDNFSDLKSKQGTRQMQDIAAIAYERLMGIMLEDNPLTKNGSASIPSSENYTIDHIFAHGYLREPRAAMFVLLAVYAYLGISARTAEDKTSDHHNPVILVNNHNPNSARVFDIPRDMGSYRAVDPDFIPEANTSRTDRKRNYTDRASGSYLKTSENP